MAAKRPNRNATKNASESTPDVKPARSSRGIPQHPQPEGYEAAAVLVPIEELVRWAGNPRDNTGTVRKVMRSIKAYGFGAPLLARADNREIIGGDTRIQAAMRLRKRGVKGLDTLPVRFMSLDELKAHGLAIADNRIGEESEWIEEKLEAVVQELDDADEDLQATGLDEEELDAALGEDDDELDALGHDEEGDLQEAFRIVIECSDEMQQAELLTRLQGEGLKVRAMLA